MKVAIVLIGRNEGARLIRALGSLAGSNFPVIYVDSGSIDDSVAQATNAGAMVVELTPDRPFTAARGRNAGFAALMAKGGDLPEYVQFIDGDCAVESDWIAAGIAALDKDETLGIVTGWRAEIHRDASIYNAMCDYEWHRPAGDIVTCGGDMMVRTAAFSEVGGFNEAVIAAEDDEFCVRIRKAGWKIRRLPVKMTRHDAAMTRFSEWWQRCTRSGHGFAQVGALHSGYFAHERKRVLVYAAFIPTAAVVVFAIFPWGLTLIAALYALSFYRSFRGLKRDGLPFGEALHHAVFLVISKFPNLIGMGIFAWRRLRGHKINIIEYK